MKKLSAVLVTSMLVGSSYAHVAKDVIMKDVVPAPQHTLFTTIEGNVTSNSFNSVKVRGDSLPRSTSNWGGRVAAGAVHHASDFWSYTAELGWGYYGQTEFKANSVGIDTIANIYGMDLLVGVDYLYNQVDLFLKAGGMNQNVRLQRKTNLTKFVPGGSVTGNINTTATISTVVPEVKIGGIYNITDQFGISLAYAYVFGNAVNIALAPAFDGDTVTVNNTTNAPPVSLSTLSLGLVYNFA